MLSAKYDHFAMWDRGDNSVLCCGGFGSSPSQRCYKYSSDEWTDLRDISVHDRIHPLQCNSVMGVTGSLEDLGTKLWYNQITHGRVWMNVLSH